MSKERFARFVARVGEFHVTDRALKAAQAQTEEALRTGTLDDELQARYIESVRRYFTGFEKEARVHLRDVDKRLEHVNQVHFNLTAERGVAVKRIEATRSVLADAEQLEATPR